MKKVHKIGTLKGGRRIPAASVSSNLTMAELSLQRGEFESARIMLKERVYRGNNDFKTSNLYGISLAQLEEYDAAQNIFLELLGRAANKHERARAGFNLGLVKFFRKLNHTGDLTVSHFNTLGMMRNCNPVAPGPLFPDAIETWNQCLSRYTHRPDVPQAFLAFAYLQSGDYDRSLEMVMKAQSATDNFFVSFYVTGRLFLDLYYLALENHQYAFPDEAVDFFEVEDYEISNRGEGYAVIYAETLLDIAMQAFLEARNQRPFCPEILLNLCHSYLLAGMPDETEDLLRQLDTMIPNHIAALELALRFHQSVLSPPQMVQGLVNRIKEVSGKNPEQHRQYIIPAYYQT